MLGLAVCEMSSGCEESVKSAAPITFVGSGSRKCVPRPGFQQSKMPPRDRPGKTEYLLLRIHGEQIKPLVQFLCVERDVSSFVMALPASVLIQLPAGGESIRGWAGLVR